ncbi:MAG: AAA family ATPase [Verrucomicrobia bacterium]|nr:AAA family ATPase [Verrucomicrobiota bacterium]
MNTLVEGPMILDVPDVETPSASTLPRPPIIVRTLDQFTVDAATNGGNLLGNRFLCRGGALLLPGPTGVGKTSFSFQAAIAWALGQPHFGIVPSGKLRSLFIQAENDDGDVAEIRDGIFRGLNFSDEDRAAACVAIQVVCESSTTGLEFVALAADLVEKHKPDLLWIDPLFAYCGCNVADQERMSQFLRNGLNPILQEHSCGLVLIHHSNKPKTGREKPDWQAGDFAYLGSGTVEIANWARAVLVLRSIGSHTVFEAVLGKRGRRSGLIDGEGRPAYSFYVRHSDAGIFWLAVTDDDLTPRGKTAQPGVEDVFSLIPLKGDISQAKLFNAATATGISEKKCRLFLKELVEDKRVHEWRNPRPGTNAAKSYSRHEQELMAP